MAWIGPVVTAIGSYLAANKAAQAGKPSATERETQQFLLDNLKATRGPGLDLLGTARTNLGNASDFWGSVLRGGYQNMLGLLGPELSGNARANQGAFGSSLRFLPRMGGTGTERLGLFDSLQGNRQNALLGLRPTSASMLGSLGSQAGSLGSSLLGQGSSGALGYLGYGLQNRLGQFDMSRAAMQSVLQALGGMDFSSFGKSTTPPPSTGGGGFIPGSFGAPVPQSQKWGVW